MYYLKIFVKTFLSLFAIMRVTGMSTKNPCSLILFLILLYVFAKLHSDRIESHILSGDMTLSVLVSVLFSSFTLAAAYQTILGGMSSGLFCAGILLLSNHLVFAGGIKCHAHWIRVLLRMDSLSGSAGLPVVLAALFSI